MILSPHWRDFLKLPLNESTTKGTDYGKWKSNYHVEPNPQDPGMTTNQSVWLITFIVILVCILIALLVWMYTGHVFVAIVVAPPVIHWILKRRR